MSEQADDHAHREKERVLPHLTQEDLDCFVDEFGRQHYALKDGRPVCGRLKKEHNREIPGEACLGVPMASGPCKVHGGKAGGPIRHGRYSRAMRALRSVFEEARKDADLLDCTRDLALMDIVTERLVERLEHLDSPSWRDELRDVFLRLQAAIHGQRHGEAGRHIKTLGELIDRGATADQVARDLVAQVDKRANRACRVNEIEVRRSEKVTQDQLVAVLREFLAVLERELEPAVYFRLVPALRRVVDEPRALPSSAG